MKGPWPPWADRDRQALCACGCGQPAPIARKTSTANGVRAGDQLRFVHGHHNRTQPRKDHP